MPNAIFSIAEEPSRWDESDDIGLESFSETDPDDEDVSVDSPTSDDGDHDSHDIDLIATSPEAGSDLPTPLRDIPRRSLQSRRRESVLSMGEEETELEDAFVSASPDEDRGAGWVQEVPAELVERAEGLPVPSPSGDPTSASLPRRTPHHDEEVKDRLDPSPSSPRPTLIPSPVPRPAPSRALGSEFELLGESDWTESPPPPTPPIHHQRSLSLSTSPSSRSSSADSPPPSPTGRVASSVRVNSPRSPSSGTVRRPERGTRKKYPITTDRVSGERHIEDEAESNEIEFPTDGDVVDQDGWGSKPDWSAVPRGTGGRNVSGVTLKRYEDEQKEDKYGEEL